MKLVCKPFKGNDFYEWQIGPFVFQIKRRDSRLTHFSWFHVWRDQYWRV